MNKAIILLVFPTLPNISPPLYDPRYLSLLSLSSSLPSSSPSFLHFHFSDAHFSLFWPSSCPPPHNLILSPNARSKTKQRAYASPSGPSAICATARPSTHLHAHPASPVRISSISSVYGHVHFLPSLATQPTPALSIASSSNSPTLTTPTLASDDPEMDPEGADLYARVSTIPVVGTAIRAYEHSKASSRVVKVRSHRPHLTPSPPSHPSPTRSFQNVTLTTAYLVRRGDDGVFREEHLAARHRPITGHLPRRICLSATRSGTCYLPSLCLPTLLCRFCPCLLSLRPLL